MTKNTKISTETLSNYEKGEINKIIKKMPTIKSQDILNIPGFNEKLIFNDVKEESLDSTVLSLLRKDYPIVPFFENKKYPTNIKGWNTKKFEKSDFTNCTGIGVKTGNTGREFQIVAIDIDIYDNEYFSKLLLSYFQYKSENILSIDKTVSGGYHIYFLTDTMCRIESRSYDLHIGKVEIYGDSKQIAIAPTKAFSKKNHIGDYRSYNLSVKDIASTISSHIFVKLISCFIDDFSKFIKIKKENNINNEIKNINNMRKNIYTEKNLENILESKNLLSELVGKNIDIESVMSAFNVKYIKSNDRYDIYSPFSSNLDGNKPGMVCYFNNMNLIHDFHENNDISWQKLLTRYAEINELSFYDVLYDYFGIDYSKYINLNKKNTPIFYTKKINLDENTKLSSKLSELKDEVQKNNYLNIVSKTGTGKTTAIVKLFEELKEPTIILVPYVSNVEQNSKRFNHGSYSSSKNLNQSIKNKIKYILRCLKKDNIMFATYDTINIINKINPGILSTINIVVDEYHNMINQYSFRKNILVEIYKFQTNFKRTITLSGTPYFINNKVSRCHKDSFDQYEYGLNDFRTIYFDSNEKINKKSLTVVNSSKYESISYAITNLDKNPEKINILLLNNKDDLLSIKKILMDELNYEESDIAILSSGDLKYEKVGLTSVSKDVSDDVYKSIIEKSLIPSYVKLVLTTQVISDGIDILNNNIGQIHIISLQNIITIEQFFARFRNGYDNLFIYNKEKEEMIVEGRQNLDLSKKYFKISKNATKVFSDEYEMSEMFEVGASMENLMLSNSSDDGYIPNNLQFQKMKLDSMNKYIFSINDNLITFLLSSSIYPENFDINYVTYDKNEFVDKMSNMKSDIKRYKNEQRLEYIEILDSTFKSEDSECIRVDATFKTLKMEYSKNKIMMKLLLNYMKLYAMDFEHSDIIALLKKCTFSRISNIINTIKAIGNINLWKIKKIGKSKEFKLFTLIKNNMEKIKTITDIRELIYNTSLDRYLLDTNSIKKFCKLYFVCSSKGNNIKIEKEKDIETLKNNKKLIKYLNGAEYFIEKISSTFKNIDLLSSLD